MNTAEKLPLFFGLAAEDLSAFATIATAAVAVLALIIAITQILVGKHEARLAVAKSIYKDYLALAMQNPQFSSASYPIENPRLHEFSKDRDDYEKYEFYVSYLLFAVEEILHLTKNSPEWKSGLQAQLRYHALYLQGQDLPESHWSSELLALRESAIAEYASEKNGG
jgi:hypothetical protein